MSASAIFFQGATAHFFRPLTWVDREACAAVLRELHERVHGPQADYAQALTKELVLEICLSVIALPGYREGALSSAQAVDAEAERGYALNLLRALKEHGWLEDYKDPIDLQPVLKLTRAGKAFAETFAELDNARHKTRQRNMRSARKALLAFLDNQDEDELLDAHDYAILAQLRASFPACGAWRPGYEALLARLGSGHLPKEAGKEGQLDPGATGCPFADEVLLPALRNERRCVDQECWPGAAG